jgi:hypothetical protein
MKQLGYDVQHFSDTASNPILRLNRRLFIDLGKLVGG